MKKYVLALTLLTTIATPAVYALQDAPGPFLFVDDRMIWATCSHKEEGTCQKYGVPYLFPQSGACSIKWTFTGPASQCNITGEAITIKLDTPPKNVDPKTLGDYVHIASSDIKKVMTASDYYGGTTWRVLLLRSAYAH